MGIKRLLILTGTINPGNMILTNRNNPDVRKEDYKKSLDSWISFNKDGYFNKIIFCENSGVNLSELKNVVHNYSNNNDVVFFQWDDNSKWASFGKGYGEAKMLEHLIKEANDIISEHDYVIKVTGRIFVPNLKEVLNINNINDSDIICYPKKENPEKGYVDSRVICLKSNIFKTLFKDFALGINDNKGIYFEHVLASQLQKYADLQLGIIRYFKELPFFIGYSGTSGLKLNNHKSNLKFYLKNFIYKYFFNKYLNSN
jgi:hypothetical protein